MKILDHCINYQCIKLNKDKEGKVDKERAMS